MMISIILNLLLIFLYVPSPAAAFEKAAPMDFIFKGGEYRERITMVIEAPITARIEGPEGCHFYLDIAVVLCFFSMTVYSLVYLFQAVFQPEKYDRRYQALDDENEPDATRTELASTSGGVK